MFKSHHPFLFRFLSHILYRFLHGFLLTAANELPRFTHPSGDRQQSARKSGSSDSSTDLVKVAKFVQTKGLEPVIIFSFARRDCERYGLSLMNQGIDFTTKEEKEQIEEVFNAALGVLGEEDRNLDAVGHILPLLKRGIGVHHSGLLPLLKVGALAAGGEGIGGMDC